MKCTPELIAELPNGRFLYRCPECGREITLRTADASRVKAICGDSGFPMPSNGVGSELRGVLHELGIKPKKGCPCKEIAEEMNAAGIDGCKLRRDEFAEKIRQHRDKWGLSDQITAGWKAVMSGLAFRLNPLDPIAGLIDEAIRRAELKATAALEHGS